MRLAAEGLPGAYLFDTGRLLMFYIQPFAMKRSLRHAIYNSGSIPAF